MSTKEFLKSKIDHIREVYLDILLRIMGSLELPGSWFKRSAKPQTLDSEWLDFIEESYSCFADDPIKRAEQGSLEIRKLMK